MALTNRDIQAATDYHNASKYVMGRGAPGEEEEHLGDPPDADSNAYVWERDLLPYPYKVYETLAPLPLPRDLAPPGMSALDAIARTGAEPDVSSALPDLGALGRIALLTNGLLGRSRERGDGQVIEFRTAGSTGALYHLELYFVCGDLADLAAGVYHYDPHDHCLRQLRAGDYRQALVEASGGEAAIASAPVTIAITSVFWRNAWYYRCRAYRHTFWDTGTELAHGFASAATLGLPAKVALGFADGAVNELLGVDGAREATVALLALGRGGAKAPPAPALTPLDYQVRPYSAREHSFTAISAMRAASELASAAEAAAWRASPLRRTRHTPEGPLTPLTPSPDTTLPATSWSDLVFRRRSTRHYDTEARLPFAAFSTVLDRATRGSATDWATPDAPPLHDLYLIIHHVEGLADGVYLHHPDLRAVELVRAGTFREQAAHIACDQEYAGAAHVNCYYLTDLALLLERYGNRGYRLAQLESALAGSRLQLAAHALGLGTVGSTSWDDEVSAFFAPRADGASYMFVAVFGVRRPRAQQPAG